MYESNNPVYNDKIQIEIETVESVLERINQLEDKKRQIYLNIQSIYSFDSRVRRTPDLEIYPRPKYLMQFCHSMAGIPLSFTQYPEYAAVST
jgi:hypothetical protein